MTFLGIDYGDARIGIAASDPLGLLASPVETIPAQPRSAALARIAELVRLRGAQTVVLGLPLRLDGEEGSAAEKVRKFAAALQPLLPPQCVVEFQDEFRSTEEAKSRLRESSKRHKNSREFIDQAAAVVILQEHLDHRNLRAALAEPLAEIPENLP